MLRVRPGEEQGPVVSAVTGHNRERIDAAVFHLRVKRGGLHHLDRVDIVTVVLQKRLVADQVRREGQFDKLGVQALSNTAADEAESRVLEHILSELLELVEVPLLVIEVDSGGNLRVMH